MPLVSVIIPVFNGEKTIRETIESVLQQTVADFELMVINDGSTDNTLSVISQIKDSRLKVFSYANAGLAASRNRGISQATGTYISFIDADDLWTADKLEAQIKALEANPQAGVAYSWTDWIDESGQFLRPGGHIIANGNVYDKLLLRDFIEGGSNVLVLAKAFAEVGGFDESLNAVEDWEMWLRLAARYEFVCVPSAQILYRISPNSMSTDVWKMEAASLQVIERALAQSPEPLDYLKRQVLAERYKYFTFKAIEGRLERRRGLTAMRFFGQAIINDPVWLLRPKIISIVLLKIALATIFPSQLAYALLKTVKR
ncbi:MAG: glycosyltransferase [Coleofasciculus sp. C1-SOL-03]|jgi:glycosyltransferase involved in cell wall biosynthesis|uniref:glycosyltransferase n=1 Tax=Coleofasciculus sp. C1-SOL-03 TaxID=3069522 RepID=UPI0032F71D26